MSFSRLTAFAARVAQELSSAGSPQTPNEDGLQGWRIDEMLMEESTLSGGGINTELKTTDDEVWLLTDGSLLLVHVTAYTVFGHADATRTRHVTSEPLNEDYARRRDGRPKWSTWIDRRGGGASAAMGNRTFSAPSPDRPPFLTFSAALSRLRPKGP